MIQNGKFSPKRYRTPEQNEIIKKRLPKTLVLFKNEKVKSEFLQHIRQRMSYSTQDLECFFSFFVLDFNHGVLNSEFTNSFNPFLFYFEVFDETLVYKLMRKNLSYLIENLKRSDIYFTEEELKIIGW